MWRWLSLLVLLVASGSRAEEVTARSVDVAPPPEAAGLAATGEDNRAALTGAAVARMREVVAKIQANLEEARDERDVVKLNCVNEKLAAAKGLLKISEKSEESLHTALERRDDEIASHEVEKVSIAQRKTEQLLVESEACVGELAVSTGETEVEITVEGVADNDPTRDLDGIFDDDPTDELLERPPPASPFQ